MVKLLPRYPRYDRRKKINALHRATRQPYLGAIHAWLHEQWSRDGAEITPHLETGDRSKLRDWVLALVQATHDMLTEGMSLTEVNLPGLRHLVENHGVDKRELHTALLVILCWENSLTGLSTETELEPEASMAGLGPRALKNLLHKAEPARRALAPDLPGGPIGEKIYLRNETYDRTLPLEVDMNAPAGMIIEKAICTYDLPLDRTVLGREAIRFVYSISNGNRRLDPARSLTEQGAADGTVLNLEIRVLVRTGGSGTGTELETLLRTDRLRDLDRRREVEAAAAQLLRAALVRVGPSSAALSARDPGSSC